MKALLRADRGELLEDDDVRDWLGAARALLGRIYWTPLALEDLKGISLYIENQRDLTAANRVCRAIYEAVQLLRRFPESG